MVIGHKLEQQLYGPRIPCNYRKIASDLIGRPLQDDEEVHHIDHDRTNNKLDNLLVCPRWVHIRLHKGWDEVRYHMRTGPLTRSDRRIMRL
jgi:hypothetical protein